MNQFTEVSAKSLMQALVIKKQIEIGEVIFNDASNQGYTNELCKLPR